MVKSHLADSLEFWWLEFPLNTEGHQLHAHCKLLPIQEVVLVGIREFPDQRQRAVRRIGRGSANGDSLDKHWGCSRVEHPLRAATASETAPEATIACYSPEQIQEHMLTTTKRKAVDWLGVCNDTHSLRANEVVTRGGNGQAAGSDAKRVRNSLVMQWCFHPKDLDNFERDLAVVRAGQPVKRCTVLFSLLSRQRQIHRRHPRLLTLNLPRAWKKY